MLHIVQVVFAGRAETPQVFLDQAGAESAYVDQVKTCWKQSYSTYCDQNGIDIDSLSSARAFLDTLDQSEKSQINYWVVNPVDAPPEKLKELQWMAQRRETIGHRLKKTVESSAAIRDGLNGLLDDLAQLSDCLGDSEPLPAGVQPAAPEIDTAPASAEKPREPVKPEDVEEEPAEHYTSKEWKTFVASIMNTYGGSRSACSLLPRPVWRQEVYSDATSLEYWDWVGDRIKRYRKKAENAGYAIIEDPGSPGHYKVKTPEGTVEETSFYSEWEAWCHAGMNLPG